MDWIAARELEIDTFTNHSGVSSAFGFTDQPSTTAKPRSLGDLPGSPAYWADYALRAGIKFVWSYIPTERSAFRRGTFGAHGLLAPATFRDGGKFWHFTRYDCNRYFADTMDSILNPANLDLLVRDGNFEVVYTHFGYWSDNSNRVNPELSQSSIDALRLLKAYQDKARILVAKTSRLLRYNLALDYLAFTAVEKEGAVIDIESIKDTQFGEFAPALRDVRGITFHVPDSSRAEIRLNGAVVPEAEILRNPPDETGRQSIGIAWFDADTRDFTSWTTAEIREEFSRPRDCRDG